MKTTAGFTLLEILLAVSLTALIAAGAVVVMAGAEGNSARARKVMESQRHARGIHFLLGAAIREMQPVKLTDADISMHLDLMAGEEDLDELKNLPSMTRRLTPPTWFRGAEDSFGFVLNRPFFVPAPDGYLHWITLSVVTNDAEKRSDLILRDAPFQSGRIHPESRQENDPPVRQIVLYKDVSKLTCTYEWPRQQVLNSGTVMSNQTTTETEWKYDNRMVRFRLPVSVTFQIEFSSDSLREPLGMRYPFQIYHKPWRPQE